MGRSDDSSGRKTIIAERQKRGGVVGLFDFFLEGK